MYLLITFVLLIKIIYSFNEINSPYMQLIFQQYMPDSWTTELQNVLFKHQNIWKPDDFTERRVAKCKAEWRQNDGINILNWNLNCQTPVLYVDDEDVAKKLSSPISVAEASLPCFLKLNISKIPKANRGVFSAIKIPKNYIFGPYKGRYFTTSESEPQHRTADHSYTWTTAIQDDENGKEIWHKIDGINENKSNWLRYVNSARFEEEQNMVAILFQNEAYYITYKTVEPGSELLIWYGYSYGKSLGLTLKPNSSVEWSHYFAPPVIQVLCNSCPEKPKEESFDKDLDNELDDSKPSDNFDNRIKVDL